MIDGEDDGFGDALDDRRFRWDRRARTAATTEECDCCERLMKSYPFVKSSMTCRARSRCVGDARWMRDLGSVWKRRVERGGRWDSR